MGQGQVYTVMYDDMTLLFIILYTFFQYMGDNVPEKVKAKTIEMLYSWTVAFPNEAKISEAYDTLRRQGKS